MKSIRLLIFGVLCAGLGILAPQVRAQTDRTYLSTADSTEERMGTFPQRVGWVNDYEKLLTANEIAELTTIIRNHQQLTGDEIAIVTTKSFAPYHDLGSYGKDLATVWGIGKSKKDKGLMIMLSKTKGEIQFVPGDGLKATLTDTVLNQLIDNKMIGSLQKELFGDALIAGTKEIIRILESH